MVRGQMGDMVIWDVAWKTSNNAHNNKQSKEDNETWDGWDDEEANENLVSRSGRSTKIA